MKHAGLTINWLTPKKERNGPLKLSITALTPDHSSHSFLIIATVITVPPAKHCGRQEDGLDASTNINV